MRWEELYSKNAIQTNIKFDKDMETVYELSYFLVDFQAVINNLTEMIYDDINAKIVPMPRTYRREDKAFENVIVNYRDSSHPRWQQEIKKDINEVLYKPERIVANYNKLYNHLDIINISTTI